MIRNEYLRFIQSLVNSGASENVRKLANIILENLDEITPLGTAGGRRIKKIVSLTQRDFHTASSTLTATIDGDEDGANRIVKLKSLNVGPFRGFAKPEYFDLDSQVVLVYGPNGTGKSSFCEALEYGLLGMVAEADSKRFRETHEYLKNAHVNHYEHPYIEAELDDGEPTVITANESEYRFCFVEKNRIDNFSRIAAHAPARQTELISTLFGLDSFNEFVRGFSIAIEDRYIDLVGANARQLALKQQTLEGDKKIIADNTLTLTQLEAEEQQLAEKYQSGISFSVLTLALGTSEHPGEIHKLESELQQPTPSLNGLKLAELAQVKIDVEKSISDLKAKEAELSGYSEGLSYKKLYQAVTTLSSISQEYCPACKTPLEDATENPYQAAKDGLAKLEHLSELEKQQDELKEVLHNHLKDAHEFINKSCPQTLTNEQATKLRSHLIDSDSLLNIEWWESLHQSTELDQPAWDLLEYQVNQFESMDAATNELLASRQQRVERLAVLRQYYEQVIQFKTRRKTLAEGISKSKASVVAFDEENKGLAESVEQEKVVVAQNHLIAESYSQFVEQLNVYKDALPSQLVANLGELVVRIYNAFNRGDAENALLADLKLPTTSGDRIQISFSNEPSIYFDALHVLSEGHIRCVGLAILLAKNLNEDCPILIFDDPVNAIDEDHKESIRLTLFEDNFFQDRQIILTCHGEEFLKDIQNLLGVERTRESKRLTFLPQTDDKHIQIDFNSSPRNYLLAAQEHYDKLEIRDALKNARQALEGLTKGKVWSYVSRHGDGNLSIKMRTANSPIELRNLTDQLKVKLQRPEFTHEDKESVLNPIATLAGMNGDSREWRYMNKGTHEEADRAEFDRMTVKNIIDSLSEIDRALN